MNNIPDALREAIDLFRLFDEGLMQIVWLTLKVSISGMLIATLIGLPLGVWLGLRYRPAGAGLLTPLIFTGMGVPPVVVGLFVFLLLSNQGPFGSFRWLFTPVAMVISQAIIALPLVLGLSMASIRAVNPKLILQIRALGATPTQAAIATLGEARQGIFAALMAGFGSIISEVGSVILVGGNIEGKTRVLTTAIVLETRKGNFSLALALGIILLGIAFTVNALTFYWQRGKA